MDPPQDNPQKRLVLCICDKSDEKKELERELEVLRAKYEQRTAEAEEHRQQLNVLDLKYDQAMSTMNDELELARAQVQATIDENKKLGDKILEKEREFKLFFHENELLKASILEVREEETAFRAHNENLNTNLASAQARLKEQMARISELEKQVGELHVELAQNSESFAKAQRERAKIEERNIRIIEQQQHKIRKIERVFEQPIGCVRPSKEASASTATAAAKDVAHVKAMKVPAQSASTVVALGAVDIEGLPKSQDSDVSSKEEDAGDVKVTSGSKGSGSGKKSHRSHKRHGSTGAHGSGRKSHGAKDSSHRRPCYAQVDDSDEEDNEAPGLQGYFQPSNPRSGLKPGQSELLCETDNGKIKTTIFLNVDSSDEESIDLLATRVDNTQKRNSDEMEEPSASDRFDALKRGKK